MAVRILPSGVNSITAWAREIACDLAGIGRSRSQLVRGDVGGDLDDLVDLAALVLDRVVGRLDADLAAALGEALERLRDELALAELPPELGIFGATCLLLADEHAVMLADDLRRLVAERAAEVLVGLEDDSLQIELDDRERPSRAAMISDAPEPLQKHRPTLPRSKRLSDMSCRASILIKLGLFAQATLNNQPSNKI